MARKSKFLNAMIIFILAIFLTSTLWVMVLYFSNPAWESQEYTQQQIDELVNQLNENPEFLQQQFSGLNMSWVTVVNSGWNIILEWLEQPEIWTWAETETLDETVENTEETTAE